MREFIGEANLRQRRRRRNGSHTAEHEAASAATQANRDYISTFQSALDGDSEGQRLVSAEACQTV